MGFGFGLLIIFILVPATGLLLIAWLLTRKNVFIKALGLIWLGVFSLTLLLGILQWMTAKTELTKSDYHGQYIVDRDYFPGRQSDWQYDHFRFEIRDNDSIYFFVMNGGKLLKTFKGIISTVKPYSSERLVIKMEEPTHHILSGNPTTFRSAWSFYLVFYSPKFNNVYFKKGRWKPLK